jgi:hypothetical protein
VTEQMDIQQRLVHLGFYKSSFNNRTLAGAINQLLQITLQVNTVVQFQLDRAEAGLVAVDSLLNVHAEAAPGACLSHTLDHCGDHIKLPTAKAFFTSLTTLMSKSLMARQTWTAASGKAFGSKSKTR